MYIIFVKYFVKPYLFFPIGLILLESDNESTTNTPVKFNNARLTNIGVKTLEEIRLEKIQEASAALYFYGNKNSLDDQEEVINNDIEQDLRQRLKSSRLANKKDGDSNKDFEILSLTEIRKRKLSDTRNVSKVNVLEKVQSVLLQAKNDFEKHSITNITSEIKIKTLDEIRAERVLKNKTKDEQPQNHVKRSLPTDFSGVDNCKRLKIQRKISISSCDSTTNCNSNNNFDRISEKIIDQRLTDNGSKIVHDMNYNTDNLSAPQLTIVPSLVRGIINNCQSDSDEKDNYDEDVIMDNQHIAYETQKHTSIDADDILQDIDQLLNEND